MPNQSIASAQSVQELIRLASQGVAEAQYKLGVMYEEGEVVKQNYSEARKWYEKAAELGDAQAKYNLGLMYYNGQGVRQDKRMAKEFFWKACDKGLQVGCDEYKILKEQGY